MGVDVQMTPAREGATDIFANGPTEPTNSIRRLALIGYSTSVYPVRYQRIGAANPRVGGIV